MFCTRLGGPSAGPLGHNRTSVEVQQPGTEVGELVSSSPDDKDKETKPNQPPT